MKNIKNYTAILLVSAFLGIILSIQLKTVNQTVGDSVLPIYRAQELATELKKVQGEKQAQLNRIDELEEKIEEYEKSESDKDVYTTNLYNDTMKYRMLAGYLDLKGPGIVLEINDPPVDVQFEFGQEYTIVDDLHLVLMVISVLNAADAEAISINDQRYTAFTEIERAGNHIEINGVSTNSPIIVKAIGDPQKLESALSLKGGVVQYLREWDYIVHLNSETSIEIPRYKRIKELIYANPTEDSN